MSVVDDLNPTVELVPWGEETLHPLVMLAAGGVLTATSLELEGDVSYETFEALGTALGGFDRACRWWVGDWLLWGERHYDGDRYADAAKLTGLSENTLLQRITMARAIPPERRNPRVSYSAHRHVAPLPARQQARWLSYAEENRSTERELRAAIKLNNERPAVRADSSADTHEPEITMQEKLADFDHALRTWEEAYPVEVFGESLSSEEQTQVTEALTEAGFNSERVHASWARHVVGSIAESFAPLRGEED